MSTAADFYRDPLVFMRTNVVRIASQMNHPGGGDHLLLIAVAEQTRQKVLNIDGKVWVLYSIKFAFNPDGMLVYYCDYKDNDGKMAALGTKAEWMFTAEMNGCTFAVGNQVAVGRVAVGHMNFMSAGAGWGAQVQDRQRQAQRNYAYNRMGYDTQLIQPEDYKGDNDDQDATTFGMLDVDTWRFWTLQYKRLTDGQYIHCGVHYHLSAPKFRGATPIVPQSLIGAHR
jgi:hypothetical protein